MTHFFTKTRIKSINYTLLNIESNLNILYEKARVLESVITYTREHVKQSIYSISDECKTILEAKIVRAHV